MQSPCSLSTCYHSATQFPAMFDKKVIIRKQSRVQLIHVWSNGFILTLFCMYSTSAYNNSFWQDLEQEFKEKYIYWRYELCVERKHTHIYICIYIFTFLVLILLMPFSNLFSSCFKSLRLMVLRASPIKFLHVCAYFTSM